MTTELPTDDRLGRALAALSDSAFSTDDCPDAETLWDLAAGGLDDRTEARRVAAHAVTCPACREALRLAREVGAPAHGRSAASSAAWTSSAWGAAAAILVAALALFGWRGGLDRRAAPEFREPPPITVKAEAPLATVLPGEPIVLRWIGVPGARYDVTLAREDLRTLAIASGLDRPEYEVTPEVAAGLRPGDRLLWQVEAVLPDGRRARSSTFTVRVGAH